MISKAIGYRARKGRLKTTNRTVSERPITTDDHNKKQGGGWVLITKYRLQEHQV